MGNWRSTGVVVTVAGILLASHLILPTLQHNPSAGLKRGKALSPGSYIQVKPMTLLSIEILAGWGISITRSFMNEDADECSNYGLRVWLPHPPRWIRPLKLAQTQPSWAK
jgi:hypothetical protein